MHNLGVCQIKHVMQMACPCRPRQLHVCSQDFDRATVYLVVHDNGCQGEQIMPKLDINTLILKYRIEIEDSAALDLHVR